MHRIIKTISLELYIGIASILSTIGMLVILYIVSIGYPYDSLGYKLNYDFIFTIWFIALLYIFSFCMQNLIVYSAPKMMETH